jgi:peptidoglycan hydrolase CwlO-like protein
LEYPKNMNTYSTSQTRGGSAKTVVLCIVVLGAFVVAAIFWNKSRQVDTTLSQTGIQLRDAEAGSADLRSQLAVTQSTWADRQKQLDAATAATTRLETEIAAFKESSGRTRQQLQGQVSRAQAGTVQFKAQVDQNAAQLTALQSQAVEAQRTTARLGGELSEARAASGRVQRQGDEARGQLSQVQARLNAAQSEFAALQPPMVQPRARPRSATTRHGPPPSVQYQMLLKGPGETP